MKLGHVDPQIYIYIYIYTESITFIKMNRVDKFCIMYMSENKDTFPSVIPNARKNLYFSNAGCHHADSHHLKFHIRTIDIHIINVISREL